MNPAASIRARLLAHAKKEGLEYGLVLSRYGVGRLLWRLSQSPHADQFILKGAQLFTLWAGNPHRPTRDLDLLGFGDASADRLLGVFRDLCAIPSTPEDGLVWEAASVGVEEIREDSEYGGTRIKLCAVLDAARIPVQVDVGFGDTVTPGPEWVSWPELLGLPPAKLRAYTQGTVIAEKLHAAVTLDLANSRMKDFYDLRWLATHMPHDGEPLAAAVRATFARRRTPLPESCPLALTETFWNDGGKREQWDFFRKRTKMDAASLRQTVEDLHAFLWPVLQHARTDGPWRAHWPPGGPWQNAVA